jgi:hypothetical protein
MAQLALAAVGAAVGSATLGTGIIAFGMTGASIGWTVGSLVGGMIGQKAIHTRQPGLGQMATLLYGTARLAGNVIDGVGEIREVENTTRVGKGGPKGSNTTLSWNVDIAIDLCQAGAQGIRKMWLGGKLVYDVSSGGTASSIIASSIKANSFVLYDGSESQLPDPTLEALHGVGNVPAYRGRSYIVIAGLDCPNGQIPQLMYELSMSITPSATLPALTPSLPMHPSTATQSYLATTISRVIGPDVVYHVTQNENIARGWNAQGFKAGNGYSQQLWSVYWPTLGTGAYGRMPGLNGSHKTPKMVRAGLGDNGVYSSTNTMRVIDMTTGVETTVRAFTPGTVDYDLIPQYGAWDEITEQFVVIGKSTGGVNFERFNPGIYSMAGGPTARISLPGTAGAVLAFYAGIIYTLDQRAAVTYLQRWDGATGAYIDEVGGGPGAIDCASESVTVAADPSTGVTVIGFDTAISAHAAGVFVYSKSLQKAWRIDSSWVEISGTIAPSSSAHGIMGAWIEQSYIVEGPLIAAPDGLMHYRVGAMKSFDPVDVSAGSMVSDLCQRAGLTAGQIDVSALTDTLRGYVVTRQISARAAIEPLLKTFFVDAREQDGKIQFLKRASQVSAFAVTYDELATSSDAQATPDPMPLSRADESLMPRSVSITYMDVDADYQVGTQRAIRQSAISINEQNDELPLAITAARAATVADVLLFDAWNGRNTRAIKISRKFAAVSPGDVGTFEFPAGTFTEKRVARANDDGAIIALDLVDADVQIYSASNPGVSSPSEQSGLQLIPPARMAIMDIPILRDADNTNALYVAMAGATTPWSGGALYIGNDDASLAIVASVSSGASVGIATTALANWTQRTVDSINTVRVEEVGTQSSTTLDGALTNHINLWLIGDELLYAITATYVSAGVYVLSNLVRGLRGTERFISTHAAYERAVQLPSAGQGIMHPALDLGDIGQIKQYRAISFGRDIDSEVSTPFASTGQALKPLSPVDFKRDSLNGSSALTWNRRSRFSGEFIDNGDIPLGESSELYYVDVYSDSTFSLIARTIQTNTPRAVYSLAQQVVDFGGYQITLYLRISQVSALVGRGNPLEITSTMSNVNSTPPSLLAHFDGAGISTTPIDSSSYAFAASLTGGATLSNTQSKFSGSSLYVPGGGGDSCNFDTSSAAHSFGAGDFTAAFWVLPIAAVGTSACFAISVPGTIATVANVCFYMQMDSSARRFILQSYVGTSVDGSVTTAGSLFTIGDWVHVAITRRSGTMRLFVDGVQRGSYASAGSLNYNTSMKVMVGSWNSISHPTNYYDDVLVLKGEALYFDAFTPPAEPY